MQGINNFLNKFKDSIGKTVIRREKILSIIREETGIDIKNENILIKGDSIKIKTNQSQKNEIYIKKESILERIKKEGIGDKKIFF